MQSQPTHKHIRWSWQVNELINRWTTITWGWCRTWLVGWFSAGFSRSSVSSRDETTKTIATLKLMPPKRLNFDFWSNTWLRVFDQLIQKNSITTVSLDRIDYYWCRYDNCTKWRAVEVLPVSIVSLNLNEFNFGHFWLLQW